jgi:GNAT superfamily N-acetyltransferase
MPVEIREAGAADRHAVMALAHERCPHTEPWLVDGLFSGHLVLDGFHVATDADTLAGFAFCGSVPGVPPHLRQVLVEVASEHEDAGLGRELYAGVRAAVPSVATDLRTRVFDDDDRALAVAQHWGFEIAQRSITSRLDLVDPQAPTPPDDVSVEAVDDLVFPDEEAVEAMFAVSQTNPEATNSHLMTLPEIRGYAFPGESPLASLARVGGVPAAICYLLVGPDGEEASVVYTGVDPQFRGRGLGRTVKEDVHVRAHSSGVLRLVTDNEEHNAGIRRLNDEMGFVKVYGAYRMRQRI